MCNFSSLTPGQIYDQNNEKIKGLGGITHLLIRPDSIGLEEWRTSVSELVRFLSEFEEEINRSSKFQTVLPHHEDTPAFQQHSHLI